MLFSLLLTFLPLVWALRAMFGLVYYSPSFVTFALFSCGLWGQFYFVCPLPCCWRFAPLVGLAGYNLTWFVICPASNVCPLLTWALRAILISYVISFPVAGYILVNSYVVCPAVNVFAPCVGFASYVWFGILFARLLNVCAIFVWALRAILSSYVLCPGVNGLPLFCGPCGLKFLLVCNSPYC